MTALSGYQRLECEGRYRAGPDAAPQDVAVQFGNASLTVLTFDDLPLAHWPLASLHRRPGGKGRMLVSPDAAAPETLEIDDAAMRGALDRVASRPPPALKPRRRGRRALMLALLLLLLVAGGTAAMLAARPYAMLSARIPPEARSALGSAAVRSYAGEALCTSRSGQRALRRFAAALHDGTGLRPSLFVAAGRSGVTASLGGSVLIGEGALQAAAMPSDLAAAVGRALGDARRANAVEAVIRQAGYLAVLDILGGDMTSPRLVAAAVADLAARHAGPAPAAPAAPDDGSLRAGLPPEDWLALKTICAR